MRVPGIMLALLIILTGYTLSFADDTQPKGLKAVAGNNVVYLSWSKPDKAVQGYWVYRAIPDGEYQKISTILLNKNFYKDTAVANGQLYWYTVTAVDVEDNENAQSENVSATPYIRKGSISGY